MAFGYRLRSQQSSRVQLEDPPQMAPIAAQPLPPSASGSSSSSSSHHRQHIRLDGLQQRPTTAGASRQHAGSMIETSSNPPQTASFLDENAQALDLAQLGRRRRGTTSTVYSARSTTSSGESDHSRRPDAAVDVYFKGHLMAKRGLLKTLDRRFYFLVRGRAELYLCKDEPSFNLWLASGWGLNVDTAVAKSSGLAPQLVCTVLRADRAGDAGGSDRGLVIVAQPPVGTPPTAKAASLKLYAASPDKCERWLHALHRVQLTKRASASSEPQDPVSPHASSQLHTRSDDVSQPRARKASRTDATTPGANSSTVGPRAYAGGQLRSNSSGVRDETGSVKSTGSSSDAASEGGGRGHFHSAGSSTHGSSQGNNVLLFVPAVGSAISVSDSKLAQARKQVAELAAQGRKRPPRAGLESASYSQPTQWRYGPPEYALADLEYMKHKEREHESTPLESYVEECCQTFLMEATHKANYNEWVSVRQEYFYLQVNDGERVIGHGIGENDMFGLLYMPGIEAGDADMKEGDEKDPRAVLAEAFTDGFPMEVLEVFTQPPQCYFAWRHWGAFTGSYKGVKGDGARLEVRGFGQMQIDANRMLSLRLFFKPKELFETLNRESVRLAAKARDVQRARAASSAVLLPSSSVQAPPVSAAPPAAPPSVPASRPAARSKATLTADIIDELANFTIASAAVRTK